MSASLLSVNARGWKNVCSCSPRVGSQLGGSGTRQLVWPDAGTAHRRTVNIEHPHFGIVPVVNLRSPGVMQDERLPERVVRGRLRHERRPRRARHLVLHPATSAGGVPRVHVPEPSERLSGLLRRLRARHEFRPQRRHRARVSYAQARRGVSVGGRLNSFAAVFFASGCSAKYSRYTRSMSLCLGEMYAYLNAVARPGGARCSDSDSAHRCNPSPPS